MRPVGRVAELLSLGGCDSDYAVGDRVVYDGEPSVVEELVDTEEKRLEWRVDYLGLAPHQPCVRAGLRRGGRR